jgi:ankyrin repeat protein
MDPLSLTANLIAVIGVAATVARRLERLRKNWNGAPTTIFTLSNEISDLQLIFNVCKDAIEDLDEQTNQKWQSTLHLASQIVAKAEMQLNQLEELVSMCLIPSNTSGAIQLFKVDRLKWLQNGNKKAKRIQEALHNIKQDLVMMLDAVGISVAADMHLSVQKISLETHKIQENSLQFQDNALQKLNNIQSALVLLDKQQKNMSDSWRAFRSIRQVHTVLSAQTSHGIGKASFENSEAPDMSIYVIARKRSSCRSLCSCRCHIRKSFRTPPIFEAFMGRLSIGYSGLPWPIMSSCNEPGCRKEDATRVRVRYQFPRWYWSSAFTASLGKSSFGDPELLFRTRRVVPFGTPTFNAVALGDLETLKDLLARGIGSPYDEDLAGDTLLREAIYWGEIDIFRFLLFCGSDMEHESPDGWSAHDHIRDRVFADMTGEEEWLTFSSAWDTEQCGYSILHKIVLGLVPLDLEEQLKSSAAAVNDRDILGRTPLFWAARRGDTSAISILMKYHASPAIPENDKTTPLQIAALCAHLDAVSLLISQGVDINAQGYKGGFALHIVAESGWIDSYGTSGEFIKLLLDSGANLDSRDEDNYTPFMLAFYCGHTAIATEFRRNGADINAVCTTGLTALAESIYNNSRVQTSLLLDWEADYRTVDKFGNTILHITAKNAGYSIIETLHYAGLTNIDVDAKNYRGYTAQEIAEQERKQGDRAESNRWHHIFKLLIKGIRRRTAKAQNTAWRTAMATEPSKLTESDEYLDDIAIMFEGTSRGESTCV